MRASCAGWMSVVYIGRIFGLARRGYNRFPAAPATVPDTGASRIYGHRPLLGQRKSFFLARDARPGTEEAAVCQSSAAVLQAGAPVAADAVAELSRARARAE